MDDGTGTCIPAVVVPYHSKTADTIKIEILEVEVLQIKLILFRVSRFGVIIGKTYGEGGIEEPVFGKHPVDVLLCISINLQI